MIKVWCLLMMCTGTVLVLECVLLIVCFWKKHCLPQAFGDLERL